MLAVVLVGLGAIGGALDWSTPAQPANPFADPGVLLQIAESRQLITDPVMVLRRAEMAGSAALERERIGLAEAWLDQADWLTERLHESGCDDASRSSDQVVAATERARSLVDGFDDEHMAGLLSSMRRRASDRAFEAEQAVAAWCLPGRDG